MLGRSLLAAVLAGALALAPTPGLAAKPGAEAAAAQKADREAQKHEKKQAWEEARAAYQKAIELDDTADRRIKLAAVEDKLGNLVEAADHLRVALDSKKLSFASRAKAKKMLKDLEKRIPTIELQVPGDFKGTVFVDDEEVSSGSLAEPIPVNPGKHKIRAESQGFNSFKERVEVAEKEKKTLTILLTEMPAEETKPEPTKDDGSKKGGGSKTLAYVSLGVGAVGLGVGVFFGLKARSTKDELDGACKNGVCPPDKRGLYDDGKNQANVSTAGFVVGAVGVGLGTVLLLTSSDKSEKPASASARALRVTPAVGPGSIGVYGSF